MNKQKIQSLCFSSDQFSRSVVSDSLRPHELQHTRPPIRKEKNWENFTYKIETCRFKKTLISLIEHIKCVLLLQCFVMFLGFKGIQVELESSTFAYWETGSGHIDGNIWKIIHYLNHGKVKSESFSVMSNSLQLHGLYSPWNPLGQNAGMDSLSLLQGILPTQG